MPMGIVGIATNLGVGFGIRHTSHRWAWAVAVTIRKPPVALRSVSLISHISWYHWGFITFIPQAAKPTWIPFRYLHDYCNQLYLDNHSG
jgi:hypothetical protein